MPIPIRHFLAVTLGRLGACMGAIVVLVMLAGLAQADPQNLPHEPPTAADRGAAFKIDTSQADCPHEPHHLDHEGACCLGLGCATALVPGAADLAGRKRAAAGRPLAPPATRLKRSKAQFRPPRAFPAV